MRAVFRGLAGLMVLIAVLAGITDVTRSMAAQSVTMVPLLEHWSKLAPGTLSALQAYVGRVPFLWTLVVKPILSIPAWLVFGWFAMMFAYFGRPRRKTNIFAN